MYFGVSGYGKGLVDAMSAFGAKTPLRRAIVTQNFDYTCANDIRCYLDELFKDDDRKCYFTLEKEDNDATRENRSKFKIKGCQAQHMFSFFPNGAVQSKVNICSCESCLVGEFTKCDKEPGGLVNRADDADSSSGSEELEEDDGAEIDDETEAIELRGDTVLGAITVGNVIGLLTPPNCHEAFYLCLVNDFGVAKTPLGTGINFVAPGEKFIQCQYLDKNNKKKTAGKVHYKLLEGTVYVNPASVFIPCVNIDSEYTMTIDEYLWLCDSVHR